MPSHFSNEVKDTQKKMGQIKGGIGTLHKQNDLFYCQIERQLPAYFPK